MIIGIRPALDGSWGGIYQYSLTTIRAAEEIKDHEFVLLCDDPAAGALAPLRARGWRIVSLRPPDRSSTVRRRVRRTIGNGVAARTLRRARDLVRSAPPVGAADQPARRTDVAAWWRRHDIGLVLYPAPTPLSFEVGVPYVIAVHDVQHRLQPEFPEVTDDGEWERRERLYRNCGRHAQAVLVDSEAGRQQFLSFYQLHGVPPDRVKVLPYVPAENFSAASVEDRRAVAAKYHLPARYAFYPAQFWPHKNHARIVQALERLKLTRGVEIPVVFCGAHSGDRRERQFALIRRMAECCGVAGQISYLGYVPDEEMPALYAGAAALVMPTLFGPTNIPPLEAWAAECPVLSSDLPDIRDQLGDAAVLVDPRSVPAIADGIDDLWTNDELRRRLVIAGRQRLGAHSLAGFRQRLCTILEEATQCLERSSEQPMRASRSPIRPASRISSRPENC